MSGPIAIEKARKSAEDVLSKGGKVGKLPPFEFPSTAGEEEKKLQQVKTALQALISSLVDYIGIVDAMAATYAKNKSVIDKCDFELDKTGKDDLAIIKRVRDILNSGIAEEVARLKTAKKKWQDVLTGLQQIKS